MRFFPLLNAILRGSLNANGKKIENLATPTADGDAVNKGYVDERVASVSDGTARPLPDYLYALDFADSYKAEAEAFYEEIAGDTGAFGCSAVRRGNNLFRNYDWTFDDAAEFVVRVSGNASRFSSVGVASVGKKLTDSFVKSGKWSKYYKALPGMTLDGINEKGVVAEINVDGGPKTGWHGSGANALHILAAVRWVLDHGETAAQAAQYLAENVKQPTGDLNFHFMIADSTATYIVENGVAHDVTNTTKVLTNYAIFGTGGGGTERYNLLASGGDITDVWFTKAYQQGNTWHSDFASEAEHASAIEQWAAQGDTKEAHRGKTTESGKAWWQTVHTTEYDFAAKTMRIAVQEQDDWYTFAVDASSIDAYTKSEMDGLLAEKLDGPTDSTLTLTGKAADAKATGDALEGKLPKTDVIDPSSATASGKAADALAVKDALAGKVRNVFYSDSDAMDDPWDVTNRNIELIKAYVSEGNFYPRISMFDAYGSFFLRLRSLYLNLEASANISIDGDRSWANFGLAVAAALKADLATLAPAYSTSTSTTYAVDDFCSYNGAIYQCIAATSGAWNPTKWAARNLSSLFSGENGKLVKTIEEHSSGGGGEDEKTQIVFDAFAAMDNFTDDADEGDVFDVAITKLSQLLGENIAA